ncbi:MAG TPA: polymer-forming cytoskeletal protein [Candidatus Polarisedimenticolaceae bacterium]|nr:polymer-forming cytoskeletal protein [Candidatus Polarisedimenticolaceae bacterium]
MAKKREVFNVAGIDTAIGSSVKLKGNLETEGDVALDGSLLGNVKSGGQVVVGINGHVKGNIQAISVISAGQVEGHIVAIDSVSLMESGQVRGDITSGRLEVAMGAIFIGTSKMKPAEATELLDRPKADSAS